MDGTIWVESRGSVGGKPPSDWVIGYSNDNILGSTFHFSIILPVVEVRQTTKPLNILGSSLSHQVQFSIEKFSINILIVEDNILNQKIALLMLQRLGYQAEVVNNGSECLQIITTQESVAAFDVIFMDVQMPVMDGLTATRMIRNIPSFSQTYPWIVALTADALPEDYEACINAGMNDYISKPINIKEIERSLAEYSKACATRSL
jgi:CheY-like chemotaxis protein